MNLQPHIRFSQEEEIDIINQCRSDISKFKPLYDAYHHQILNYIYHKVMDKELAADICSQVFLNAMSGIKKYKIQNIPFSSWLYKIAFNETQMYFRRSKKHRFVILDEKIIDGLHEKLHEFDKVALLNSIEYLVGHLSSKDLELIELSYYENKSFREIGTILCCSENTAKVRSHRLMMKLKKELIKNIGMKNIKIIHDRKNIPRVESDYLIDFDVLMEKYQKKSKQSRYRKYVIRFFTALFIFSFISFTVYTILSKRSISVEVTNSANEIQTENVADNNREPLPPPSSTRQAGEDTTSVVNSEKKLSNSPPPNASIETKRNKGTNKAQYTEARPIIGFPALYQYFNEKLVYPEELALQQIGGIVVIEFVIDTLGRPVDISIEIPLHPKLDSLAVAVIDNMPTWLPATKNQKPIRSTHRIPLSYHVEQIG